MYVILVKVDATILEVGIGGLYDSTNIVPNPIVTGVSAIGFDHVNTLGNTLKEIAYNKGGIFKVHGMRSYEMKLMHCFRRESRHFLLNKQKSPWKCYDSKL
jgi:folylpolyglutamate synthase/dihydropteroate synthase